MFLQPWLLWWEIQPEPSWWPLAAPPRWALRYPLCFPPTECHCWSSIQGGVTSQPTLCHWLLLGLTLPSAGLYTLLSRCKPVRAKWLSFGSNCSHCTLNFLLDLSFRDMPRDCLVVRGQLLALMKLTSNSSFPQDLTCLLTNLFKGPQISLDTWAVIYGGQSSSLLGISSLCFKQTFSIE